MQGACHVSTHVNSSDGPAELADHNPLFDSDMHTLAVTANYVVLMATARRLDYEAFLGPQMPGFFSLWPITNTPALLHIFKRSSPGSKALEYIGERSLERCHMVLSLSVRLDICNLAATSDLMSLTKRQHTDLAHGKRV